MTWFRRVLAFTLLAVPLCLALTYQAWHAPIMTLRFPLSGKASTFLHAVPNASGRPCTVVTDSFGSDDLQDVIRLFDGGDFKTAKRMPFKAVTLAVLENGDLMLQRIPSDFGGRRNGSLVRPNSIVNKDISGIYRYRWSEDTLETILSLDQPYLCGTMTNADCTVLAVACVGREFALTMRFYDLPSGRLRSSFTAPNRTGTVDFPNEWCAAADWALSPDGKRLVMAEGWDYVEMTTPEGIEIFDTETGKLQSRIVYDSIRADLKPRQGRQVSKKYGAANFRFDGEDGLSFTVAQRANSPSLWRSDPVVWDFYRASLLPGESKEPAPVRTLRSVREIVPNSAMTHWWSIDRDNRTIEITDLNAKKIQSLENADYFNAVDANGVDIHTNHSATDDRLFIMQITPKATGTIGDLLRKLQALLGNKSTLNSQVNYAVYDRRDDRAVVVTQRSIDKTRYLGQMVPHGDRLLISHQNQKETFVDLELWELPSQRKPWRHTVPLGCAIAALIVFTVVMLRRDRSRVTVPA